MTISNTIMELVQHADTQPKPTRQRAQCLIRSAIVDNPGLMDTLAPVYRYLMPQNRRKPRTAFEWVAQAAAGKKDQREFLRFVYVDGESIVATNGHRLHCAKNDQSLSDGFYHPATGDQVHFKDWNQYPDWERAMPKPAEGDFTRIAFNDMLYDTDSYARDNTIVAIPPWMEGSGYGFQLKYLEEAFGSAQFSGLVYQQAQAPQDPLVVLSEFGKAVIMPIRLPRRDG